MPTDQQAESLLLCSGDLYGASLTVQVSEHDKRTYEMLPAFRNKKDAKGVFRRDRIKVI